MKTSTGGIGSAVVLAWAIFGCALTPAAAQQQDRGVEVVTLEADAESRRALVIGNAEYESGKLRNPLHDAAAMEAMLRELGFEVEVLTNAGLQAMEDAIRAFGLRLRSGGVGLFYYAGHAVQVDGVNYLVPVGAGIRAETEIRYKTVNLGFLLDHMGEARNRLNVVILDACRDNPFRSFRSLKRGLAETRAPTGTLIAYGTAPGDVAADGTGRHGVFTEHLLAALRVPGLTIEEVMKRTRRAVIEATAEQQVPWTASSLVGELILRPLPPMPSGSEFSLADLRSRADAIEAVRRAWAETLEKMKTAFDETRGLSERAIPVALKVEAWDRFLAAFAEDNPFSAEDEAMRSEGIRQRERWRREAQSAPQETAAAREPPPPRQPQLKERWEEKAVGMWFRYVPAGRFQMGSPQSEKERDDDETLHQVELTRGFWIGETEVTQAEWRKLVDRNPPLFANCSGCPVERVNWFEAVQYANLLSEAAGKDTCYQITDCQGTLGGGCGSNELWCGGDYTCAVRFKGLDCEGYRLPTEAEWEYAARAGTSTPFWTGENLTTDQANYNGNYPYAGHGKGQYREKTVEARSFDPNPWGLHEVHGNVREWVWDWFGSYEGKTVDPTGPGEGSSRVVRGGGWRGYARGCRAAFRFRGAPGYRFDYGGFRLVRTYP